MATRWNSTYDAVADLNRTDLDQLEEAIKQYNNSDSNNKQLQVFSLADKRLFAEYEMVSILFLLFSTVNLLCIKLMLYTKIHPFAE